MNKKKLTKTAGTAQLLLRPAGANRFEAERRGDHCLHSTVSDLMRNHGIEVAREWEWVPTRFHRKVRVKRYWIVDARSRRRARELVERSSGAKPVRCSRKTVAAPASDGVAAQAGAAL